MDYRKYQHIENKFTSLQCEGLTKTGTITVQSKLDGSNCQVWYDAKSNKIRVGSRNRLLSIGSDNKGCYQKLSNDERFIAFFKEHPNVKLVGEWLVKHKVEYVEEAYNELYVFDAIEFDSEDDNGKATYYDYTDLANVLNSYGIKFVPAFVFDHKLVNTYLAEFFKSDVGISLCNFLCKDATSEKAIGEGVVIKNYSYKNRFGRSVWCKLINEEWYKLNAKVKKQKVYIPSGLEDAFVSERLTEHFLSKELNKLEYVDMTQIGTFIKACIKEFLEDFEQEMAELNVKLVCNIITTLAKNYILACIKETQSKELL